MLSAQEITQLLNAFDRSTATSKRDYAIVRCLLDLGLRRTEVARLRLEDVDWRAGPLRIHTKGKRIDVLPLPQKNRYCDRGVFAGWPPIDDSPRVVRAPPPTDQRA